MNTAISENNNLGAQQVSHATGEILGQWSAEAINSTVQSTEQMRSYISHNPVRSVAMGATAGFLIGGLIAMVSRNTPAKN